jgi:hypothetical protein
MRQLYVLAAALCLSALLSLCALAGSEKKTPEVPPREGTSETIKLFNGKDLDGWEGRKDLWSVEEGVIVARNTEPIKVSTYLQTKRKFTDFRLLATVKLVKSEMHSGIAFWGRKAPEHGDPFTYAGHLVMFPSGWGMYDLFGRNGLPVDGGPARKVGKQHDWNKLEILAQGNRVRLAVNGTAVVDWRDPEPKRIKEGPIGLQLHSNKEPQEVHFKDLVLTTFPEPKLITVRVTEAERKIARLKAQTLGQATLSFIINNGKSPEQLVELLQKNDLGGPYLKSASALVDPWGQPFQFNPDAVQPGTGQAEPEVFTIAPDGTRISSFHK